MTLYAVLSSSIDVYRAGSEEPSAMLTGLSAPSSIAVDAAGEVYVADSGKGGIEEFPLGATKPATLFAQPGVTAVTVAPSSAFVY